MLSWMKRTAVLGAAVLAIAPAAQAADPVKVMASWGGKEEAGFREVLNAFTAETGIEFEYEGIREMTVALKSRVAGGNPPDIALIPRPGEIAGLARRGVLTPVSDLIDMAQFDADYSQSWRDLGTIDGSFVALITKANSKSFVWYRTDTLAKYTDTAPQNWAEFTALADKMLADGLPPHAIAGGKAWTLTDWFENIYLRTAGTDAYHGLFVDHSVKWTDPSVREAMVRFSEVLHPAEKVAGGPSTALSLHYTDALAMVLTTPPEAGMFMEGGFMKNFATESFSELVCGESFGAFPFPEIDASIESPVVGGGDLAVAFNDNPGTAALMQFLASSQAMSIWATAKEGAVVSPNKGVSSDLYDTCTAQEADMLKNAENFVFDGSDLAPGAVGGDAMFVGLQQFVAEPDALDDILSALENAADAAY